MTDFTHYDQSGSPSMVDISEKAITRRTARAIGSVRLQANTIDLIKKRLLPKGDLFEIARLAGIMAAKRTAELIPLCHQLNLSHVDVNLRLDEAVSTIRIESKVILEGRTGAEMEALVAVSTAALTVYDMCKAVDKSMVIEGVQLVEKRGGKSDIHVSKPL